MYRTHRMFRLKSNMDRFIVQNIILYHLEKMSLKSNMDRFIGFLDSLNHRVFNRLKSNMDRFIVKRALIITNFATV